MKRSQHKVIQCLKAFMNNKVWDFIYSRNKITTVQLDKVPDEYKFLCSLVKWWVGQLWFSFCLPEVCHFLSAEILQDTNVNF